MSSHESPDPMRDEVVVAAAAEHRTAPSSPVEAADLADHYHQMAALAALLDGSAAQVRQRSGLAAAVLADPDLVESAGASPATHARAEEALRAASDGPHGLEARAGDLDADALVLRATVRTYRWIDDLQALAERTLGSIAGRAVGYLAPEVALGGSLVSVGLIETDALDRDGVAAFLSELADTHPELFDHATTGGGGLVDSLRMRALLTAGVLDGEQGGVVARGGLRAIGVEPLPAGFAAALRDAAGGLLDDGEGVPPVDDADTDAPTGLQGLLDELDRSTPPVTVRRLADDRYLCLLPGPGRPAGQVRLVGGDVEGYTEQVRTALAERVGGRAGSRVLLAGSGMGGTAAARLAATDTPYAIDQVVTVGSPSAQVPRIAAGTHVLALEDRSDPVAVLGSLMNAGDDHRLTVVHDTGEDVAAGAAVDAASDPAIVATLTRLRELGYLAE